MNKLKKIFIIYLIIFGIFFESVPRKISTNGTIPISINSLNQNATSGQAMFTIDTSDQYLIPELFSLKPTATGVIGILIDTDNVFLHFGRNTITHDTSDGGTNFIALKISAGKSNITIVEGAISSINGSGIEIGQNCHDINIINMQINECTKVGLDIDTCNNIKLEDIQITNCDGSDSNATEAIGLKLATCNDIKIINSNFNNNLATNNKDAIGVSLSSCINCDFENCFATSNIGGAGTGGKAFGFKLVSTKACNFINCEADNNKTVTANNCYGFYLDTSNGNRFENCKANSNNTTTSSGSPIIAGFYLTNSSGNIFQNCISKEQNASTSTGYAFGFFSSAGNRNTFSKCTALGNTAGTSSSSIGAGFALRNGESCSIISDSFSIANNGGTGEGYGIILGFTGDSGTISQNIIHNNSIYNNIGSAKKYGYRDFTSPTTTVLTKNISSGHGAINPGLLQLTASNNMNYMFTFGSLLNHEPQLLVEEINLAQVGSTNVLSSTPFVNLSITD